MKAGSSFFTGSSIDQSHKVMGFFWEAAFMNTKIVRRHAEELRVLLGLAPGYSLLAAAACEGGAAPGNINE